MVITSFAKDEVVKIIGNQDSTCPVKPTMIGQVYKIEEVKQMGKFVMFGIRNRIDGLLYFFTHGEITK